MRHRTASRGGQAGFVLIVTLIFLIALTLYVLFAARIATLSERIAGANHERTLSFYAAELALRRAEKLLSAKGDELGLAALSGVPANWSEAIGQSAKLSCTLAATPASENCKLASGETNAPTVSGSRTQPSFVIGKLPSGSADSEDYYVVTAIGYGKSGDSVTVLQEYVRVY
ncbi:pilus assembly PilX family protein [Chitinimonas koreensis]|uniref:pilus assembly PilX family protein n=1 Tax=Chitinimonas koreensis TaxID=356302 RepID=UPI000417889F|nr:PilX N-terminal domain-containing pilus assembly protein [Chitinimonas koreensis]